MIQVIAPARGGCGVLVQKMAATIKLKFVQASNKVEVLDGIAPQSLDPLRVHLPVINAMVPSRKESARRAADEPSGLFGFHHGASKLSIARW